MRIYLKKNWAKNIDFDSEDAIYVGRTSELGHLKSYLINNNSGSILISGLRGVGKTAFVNKLAIELIKEYSKPPSDLKLLPVMVNISQIDIENQNVYDLLIRLIIRRLYNQLSEEGNKEIELLYRKTFCDVTKFQELNSENDIEEIDNQVNQTRFDINVENIIRTILIIAGSIFVLEDFGIALKILGIASLVGTSFHYSKFFEKQRKIRQKRNLTTKEIYKQDNSTDNLEFDLKEFLRNNRKKFKFLFIIDELDKIDEENVFKVMRFYKNLFTSSNANYLFITDQKIYDKIVHSNKASDTHSTLFTHKIFLTDPTYKELRLYSEAIVDKYQDNEHTLTSSELDKNQKSLVSNIFDFLLFESQLDYFNLKRLINELLDYDGTTPFLNTIELSEEHNYEVIKLKATILKLLSQVYEVYKFKYYNNLMQNQNNLDILFSCFHKYTTSNFKCRYPLHPTELK